MGRRGPKPQSPEERRAKGNPGHRRDRPPAPPVEIVDVDDQPEDLKPPATLTASGRRFWRQLSPIMRRVNLLKSPDVIAFARYCNWLARYVDVEKDLRKDGIVRKTKSKFTDMHRLGPAFQAMIAIEKVLIGLEDRFGMNPKERLAIIGRLAGDHPGKKRPPIGPVDPPPGPQPAADVAAEKLALMPAPRSSPIGGLNKTRH